MLDQAIEEMVEARKQAVGSMREVNLKTTKQYERVKAINDKQSKAIAKLGKQEEELEIEIYELLEQQKQITEEINQGEGKYHRMRRHIEEKVQEEMRLTDELLKLSRALEEANQEMNFIKVMEDMQSAPEWQ